MAQDMSPEGDTPIKVAPLRRTVRWVAGILAAIALIFVLLIAFLHTPPGRQFIVDQIAKVAPASGLRVEVADIDGSILWSSTLNDVKLYDANDTLFLEVPTIDLNWRPLNWFTNGLDVRHLVLTDGTLYAAPELEPGDPDAPILPDFDIHIERFLIENLTVAEGLLGEERVIDFAAEADISSGRVQLDADGELGGADVFAVLVDARPDGDVFDIDLTWQAPAGGLLATMVGAEQDLSLSVDGEGSWSNWQGELLALQPEGELANFDIYSESGQYRLVGQANPSAFLQGLPQRAMGERVDLSASGTLENSVLRGDFILRGRGVDVDGSGSVDLANNRFENLVFAADLLDPTLFSSGIALEGARLEGTLDGAFRQLTMPHRLTVSRIDAGGIIVTDVRQSGVMTFDGTRARVPLDAQIARIVSGNSLFDPRLNNGDLGGTLIYTGGEILSDDLDVRFPGLTARLGLNSDLRTGLTRVNGPLSIDDLPFENVGLVDTDARVQFRIGGGASWMLRAELDGRVDEVTNSTIANLAGGDIAFNGGLVLGAGSPLAFNDFDVDAPKLTATLDGRVEEGRTSLAGFGRHADYGPFEVEATLADDGPRAELVFEDPLPSAGLVDVRVSLEPSEDGFAIETAGQSLLGAFDGELDLTIDEAGQTAISISRLDVAQTGVSGTLNIVEGGFAGILDVDGGGLDGSIDLAVGEEGQGFDIELQADNARFTGATPLGINRGSINANGVLGEDNTSINGSASLQGLSYGNFFIGRLAADAEITNGDGRFDAAIAGRRGSRFDLLVNGRMTAETEIDPQRFAVAVDGSFDGRDISMPRRAVVEKTPDGGWALGRSQLSYGNGFVIASGRFGGTAPMQGRFAMNQLPLNLVGALGGDLGLGGSISGVVELAAGYDGLPVGEARISVNDLTRSSLLLTSAPLDIALVADLSETLLQTRAVIRDGNGDEGRLQARIRDLPASGGLPERLYAGELFGQFRYAGSAAALWRLSAIDLIDVTGQLEAAANVRGSLGDPRVRGSLSGDNLRLRSALTGTDITNLSANGTFTGSRLALTSFAGTAPNGGRVSGSGFIDLTDITTRRGPQIDLRIAANNAEILDLENMGATVTGPMRIVSNGVGGTIAGRLSARSARWQLGAAEAIAQLPSVEVNEVNLPADAAPSPVNQAPWRYLIDVSSAGGIEVDGLGLDSVWRTNNLLLRGTTDDPRLGGSVSIVPRQGFYSFAGTRFDITRGEIDFDRNVPLDPRIDLTAEADVNNVQVEVSVRGNASQPEIAFSSVPALPEEELLARLLFGGSITDLSATDALQLGAALASLRGGGGSGPINQLRDAIGLDRLRIVSSDPALDRGTAVALGKNFGRRFYLEIITDGAGYNATNAEFRITSWLNLLGTVSTIGRHQVAAEYRRDY